MKTQNIIIGALTVAVVTLSILLFRVYTSSPEKTKELIAETEMSNSNLKGLESAESSMRLEEKLRKLLCASMQIKNDGEVITSQQASLDTAAFNAIHRSDDVKAFHIGLVTMNAMLADANAYNQTAAGIQQPIIGFRCYRSISTRTMSDGVPINNKYDLVIVPSLTMYTDLTTGRIYSHTRPCPKLCEN